MEPGAAESLPTESAAPSEAAPSEAAPSETSILDQAAEQAAEQAANPRPAPLPYNVGAIAPVADVEELDAESPEQPAEQLTAAANTSVEGMEAVFIDGNAQAGEAIEQTAVTDGMPKVVSRAGWGADESKRCMGPTYDNGVKAMTLHHTAGNNNYTKADAAAQMRGIYQYHAVNLGWCDIGYNVLVDKFGTIYEGRYGGLRQGCPGRTCRWFQLEHLGYLHDW